MASTCNGMHRHTLITDEGRVVGASATSASADDSRCSSPSGRARDRGVGRATDTSNSWEYTGDATRWLRAGAELIDMS